MCCYRVKLLPSSFFIIKSLPTTTLLVVVVGWLLVLSHGVDEEGSGDKLTLNTLTNVSTRAWSNSFNITWTQQDGDVVDCYEIRYCYQGPCPGVTEVSGNVTVNGSTREYTVSGLQEFSNYTVILTAINMVGNNSTTTTVTTLASAPNGPPQSLTVNSTTLFSITIQWSEVECLEQNSAITGYSVRYGMTVTVNVTGASNRMFTATGLTPYTNYTFEVAAVSDSGTGPFASTTMETNIHDGVDLLLNGVLYGNNSIVTLDEIGEDSAALFCLTNKIDCCRASGVGGIIGEWFFPNGSLLNNEVSGDDIYRGRGPRFVRLHRRNNTQTTGVFHCEVPDTSGANQTLYVGVYPVNSGSPSVTGLLYDRSTLALTCTSTGGPATTVTWTHNNDQITMNETNIQEKRIVNAALGKYQNILVINSEMLEDYVGNFACKVGNLRGSSNKSIVIQATQITGHEQPLALGEPAVINCTSDLEVERIEWLDSDNELVTNKSGEQQLTLNIKRVNHGENNAVFTCRIMTSRPNGTVTQNITLSVNGRKEPFQPQNVKSSDLTADSANISWTVPILASTPETYVVLYGIINANETMSTEQQSQPGVQNYHVILNNLRPNTKYKYTVKATNDNSSYFSEEMKFMTAEKAESTTTPTMTTSSSTNKRSDVGAAVGIVIGVFMVILIIIILIVIIAITLWSLRRKGEFSLAGAYRPSELTSNDYTAPSTQLRLENLQLKGAETNHQDTEDNEDYFENVSALVNDHLRPIPMVKFEEHVKEMHLNRDRLFELEYTSISSVPQASSDISAIPQNKQRNRFDNIYPYDFSRVPLKEIPGEEGSDYINASYIDGYKKPKAYIAAQGPMPNTLTDFWRMIWEYKLPTVVMLTRCFEERKKCEVYWPEKIGESIEPGLNLTVTLDAMLPFAEYTIRTLSVKSSSEPNIPTLEVTQFHFVGWPDHGVPSNAIILINFIRRVRKTHPFSDERHLLVHCSAGVGRTGTFIILDSMLQRMKEEDSVNIYESVRQLRTQRVQMVQTQAQYVFIHDALNELVICGDTEIEVVSVRIAINRLSKTDKDDEETNFQKQFQNLDKVAPQVLDIDYSHANEEYNLTKNRYQNKIPNNFTRVRVKPTGMPGSDYINASFIDGYRQRGAYIATQGPLESTVNDFWRMIWEYKSHCIVMLCNLQEDGMESCHCYWPTSEGFSETYGKIVVKLESEKTCEDYITRKFELTEDKQLSSLSFSPSSLSVTQFQFLCWPEHSPPQETCSLLELVENVNRVQMSSGNKAITIMCNDGVGRSGTFICIHSQLERLKTEGVVDFFQFIKSARILRTGIIPEVSQYMFCHDVAESYLDKFDAYANFKF